MTVVQTRSRVAERSLVGGLGALALALVLAGCSGGGGDAQSDADPIDVLQGTWTCVQEADPGSGAASEWIFTVTDNGITIENPGSDMVAEESYELSGTVLTLTDVDVDGGRLQAGYEDPATADLPTAVPADGESFTTAISLPSGDEWGLSVTRAGETYVIRVAEPQDEVWTCAAGDQAPTPTTDAHSEQPEEPTQAPSTAADLSTPIGWCQAALSDSGVLDLLSGADVRGSAFISNAGAEQLGWSWDCTYNSAGVGGAASANFAPAAWGDPAEAIDDVLSPDNPLFASESKTWNGSQPGAVTYGTPTMGALTLTGVAQVTASDGSLGTLSLSIYFGDGTSETVVPTAIAAMEAYFGFAQTNPPFPTTDGPAHSG
ncbi:hypothetical protein AB1K54_16170 [Microbacterium sp. BWT-B31]|uniref:hypothetical protein n=1 Tax=Microbacterium sp. BWT-B31 TaxID=3232072 RepID=UPI0035294856